MWPSTTYRIPLRDEGDAEQGALGSLRCARQQFSPVTETNIQRSGATVQDEHPKGVLSSKSPAALLACSKFAKLHAQGQNEVSEVDSGLPVDAMSPDTIHLLILAGPRPAQEPASEGNPESRITPLLTA
ncbi:hypothetical protein CERZMDRAFT_82910 [Cercospora zeae-maydis SCOH1-5]|uniref:Uncharacterized protein n=1 Tax=Cercospora zeae-maydis SCOH1-5 TaxID=717836 RepID=A0A6A6FNJ3_9PEZI|nr:hypothetical protein CERZMDRAFT_82910 [Cercospora zeae-maydis SCOH1-5]